MLIGDRHLSVYLLNRILQSSQICCSQGKFHPRSSALTEETIPRTLAGVEVIFFAAQEAKHLEPQVPSSQLVFSKGTKETQPDFLLQEKGS